MRRLAIGNAVLAIALVSIIFLSSINLDGTTFLVKSQTASIQSPVSTYYLTITGYPSSATAGKSFSGIIVTAYASNGSVLTSYRGSVYFTSTDPKATLPYTAQKEYTFSASDKGVHTFSGFNLVTAGSQTITVTDGTSSATSTQITVSPSAVVSIQTSPKTSSIISGSNQVYTATATDYYGNSWDVTALASWSITTGASGSWSGNTYTSAQAGTWTVTGSYSSHCSTASLVVAHSTATKISVISKTTSSVAGSLVSFNATAYDSSGNSWDVTSSVAWSISSGAGASWSGNICNATKTGTWIITGTYGSLSSTTSLTVTNASPTSIAISPSNPTSAEGSTILFNATASDVYGNTWDVTKSTSWKVSSGAGGSWNSSTYTCGNVGTWNITATYSKLTAITTLTVGYANVFSIAISPKTVTMTAGSSITFNATATDIYGNVWDVSSAATWSISSNALGSWSGNTYASAMAGNWTVTALYRGVTNTASVTVNHSLTTKITVQASSTSTIAGSPLTCTATAFDSFGNFWDVTSSVAWSISSGAGASWSGNICNATKTGTWTITGTCVAPANTISPSSFSNTASLTVNPSSPVSLTVSPKNATVSAGSSLSYAATASDKFSNNWDVSASATWQINSSAIGSWKGSTYNSAIVGVWIVTGSFQGFSTTALLNVTNGYATKIQINPQTLSLTAGLSMAYAVTAFDSFNNSWDATGSATFGIDAGAGGSWNGNVYTAYSAGTWSVTASSLGLSNTAALTVVHAQAVQISLGPNSASITAGSKQTCTATAYDNYNNPWDVSNLTGWSITSGAGGSWNSSVYTSFSAGSWTISGNYLGLVNTAYLTVTHGTAISLTVSPKTLVIPAGSNETFTALYSDAENNTWDISSSAGWSITPGAGGSWTGNIYKTANVGNWIVTATSGNLSNNASLSVTHGSIVSIVVSPKTTSIAAGVSQTFTASALDSYGNSWDVTGSMTWSITSGSGGSWSGNTYTSATAGTWNVTGSYSGFSNTASLTVTHGSVLSITISPKTATLLAGTSQAFTATASDQYGNSWDVTNSISWNVGSGAGGSWSGNSYTAAKAGTWTVTGTLDGYSSSASLTITHALSVASLTISPSSSTLAAGSSQSFTATAYDSFGNSWDVSGSTVWSGSGGSWEGNSYTSETVGSWTITGTYSNVQGSSSLTATVNNGSIANIVIAPENPSIAAGSSQAFTATAFDSYGNSWDITNLVTWSISNKADGSWSGNVYTSAIIGIWTVTASYSGLTDTANLVVSPDSPVRIVVGSTTSSAQAGTTAVFTATAQDSLGNSWDVTNFVTWTVSPGAGGSLNGNTYTSAKAGTWSITGTMGSLSDEASLAVVQASPVNITISPKYQTLVSGNSQEFTATATDSFGNTWDVTGLTAWSGSGGSWLDNVYTSAVSGSWTITGTYSGLSDTADLTVNPGSVFNVAISPASSSITAGSNQAFIATASDSNGNKWDVTNATYWSIDAIAQGSWLGNVYTSSDAGVWVITGTCSGISGTASLTVNHGSATNVNLGLSSNSITAGSQVVLNATASDSQGNTWEITNSVTWTIDGGAGGSLSNNVYTSELAGEWNITVTYGDLSNSVFLEVSHSSASSISVSPYNIGIAAGSNEAYSATAVDSFGNSWDVTNQASWSITPGAEGSWNNNTYTSSQAGAWIITCTVGNLESTAPLIVNHGAPNTLVITPNSQTTSAGANQAFVATAYDSNGNSWDAAGSTVWTIDPSAAGSWSNNVYTAGEAGTWTVSGTFGSISSSTPLIVTDGPLSSITINPANAAVTSGSSQIFNATASDVGGNTWDITNSVNWSIDLGAGGNWLGNNYTSLNPGTWTVSCSYAGTSGATQINVGGMAQPFASWLDLNHDGTVNFQDLVYFLTAYMEYGSTGICNPACDFNHDGQINFQDLVIYLSAYMNYVNSPS